MYAYGLIRFIKLPPWVKLIVTGRPQTETSFAAWKPEWIEPGDKDNQADMRMLLEARLRQGNFVSEADLPAAIGVLLNKSQVRAPFFVCCEITRHVETADA